LQSHFCCLLFPNRPTGIFRGFQLPVVAGGLKTKMSRKRATESEMTASSMKNTLRKERAKEASGMSKTGANVIGSKASARLSKRMYVNISGRVESGHIRGAEQLMCSYEFSYGSDWRLQGQMSAATCDSQYSTNVPTKSGATAVWNFPINATFTTTNIHGWPRLVVTICDHALVARGYGVVAIPPYAGHYIKYIPIFVPTASAPAQSFLGWLLNAPPEFRESKFTAQNDDREVTRVSSGGVVKVVLNVSTRGLAEFGFTEVSQIQGEIGM
jgi:B9 domain-containing protein 1